MWIRVSAVLQTKIHLFTTKNLIFSFQDFLSLQITRIMIAFTKNIFKVKLFCEIIFDQTEIAFFFFSSFKASTYFILQIFFFIPILFSIQQCLYRNMYRWQKDYWFLVTKNKEHREKYISQINPITTIILPLSSLNIYFTY